MTPSALHYRIILVALFLTPPIAGAQEIPASVPIPVVRRLVQGIWPDQLFDTLGRPEQFQAPTSPMSYPVYSKLRIAQRQVALPRFQGVILYIAQAGTTCFDCGPPVERADAVVALRGQQIVSILKAADLQRILLWAEPRFTAADSVELRSAVIALFATACLPSCNLRQVRRASELTQNRAGWAPAVPWYPKPGTPWDMPETHTSADRGLLEMSFALTDEYSVYSVGLLQLPREWLLAVDAVAHMRWGP